MMRISARPILFIAFAGVLASCSSNTGIPPGVPPLTSSGNDSGHYAGTYYPIYGHEPGNWIDPTDSMPFDKVGDIFVAFAHTYEKKANGDVRYAKQTKTDECTTTPGYGAVLDFERSHPDEPKNLKLLEEVARRKNPHLKLLISLGWEHCDWAYIANDYENKTALFVPSVIAFLRNHDLDGFDIDDEGIGTNRPTGYISQEDFDAVIAQLRAALDEASKQYHRTYALVITPAGQNDGGIEGTNIDTTNAHEFDWINLQSYFDATWSDGMIEHLKGIGYPAASIAVGIDSQANCNTRYPEFGGLKGIFNWTMSADSICGSPPYFKNTLKIAEDVGYSI